MTRNILDEAQIHPAIRQSISEKDSAIVYEVQAAIAGNPVLVVGMAKNPFCGKARRALDAIGTPYKYLEFGGYLSQWQPRTRLKMWTGWPTFPMVFVKGTLIGGARELQGLIKSGELAQMMAA